MGHLSLTTFLQSAKFKVRTIYITIPPHSRVDQGGGFDAPNEKCPPDRGSLDCVTGSPAPFFSSKFSPIRPFASRSTATFPLTPESIPSELPSSPTYPSLHSPKSAIPIPTKITRTLPTPPLTPEDTPLSAEGSFRNISLKQSSTALDFLTTLFPRSSLTALPYAKSISITSPALKAVWEGVVLDLPDDQPTLYVHGKGVEHMELRESIVALLDLASEHLQCSAFVIALEKSSPVLAGLLHSLMYINGTVVRKPPFVTDPSFVLVGIEI